MSIRWLWAQCSGGFKGQMRAAGLIETRLLGPGLLRPHLLRP